MGGISPNAYFRPMRWQQEDPTTYKVGIDAGMTSFLRIAGNGAPRPQLVELTQNMTMLVDPVHFQNGQTVTELGAWATGNTTSGSATIGSIDQTSGAIAGCSVLGFSYASINTTGNPVNGSTAITLASTTGMYVGMPMYGAGIQPGTTLSSISGSVGTLSLAANQSLTATPIVVQGIVPCIPIGAILMSISGSTGYLNVNANASVNGALLIFGQPIGNTTVSGNTTSGSATIGSLSTTAGIFAGMVLTATGVPGGVTVLSVNSSAGSLTISSNATITNSGVALSVTIPVPVINSRIDRVLLNRLTGATLWVAGTAGASPSPPAITSGYVTCAQISVSSSTGAISNLNIDDERNPTGIGTWGTKNATLVVANSAQSVGLAQDGQSYVSSGAFTATIAASASLSSSWGAFFYAQNGAITITANGADTITSGTGASSAGASVIIPAGSGGVLTTDGAGHLYLEIAQESIGNGTLASASTCDIGSIPAPVIQITGTTPITSLGASIQPGQSKLLYFAGILTLTNNANIVLQGNANITTAAGDMAIAFCTSAGVCYVAYFPANGQSVVGTSDNASRQNILLDLAGVAKAVATSLRGVKCFADGYGDTSGIYAAGSSNYSVSGSGQASGVGPTSPGGTTGTGGMSVSTSATLNTANGRNGGLQFVAPATGWLTQTDINVNSVTTSGTWHAELWTDNAGSPGTKIGNSSASISIPSSGTYLGVFSGTSAAITNGGTYWIVWVPDNTSNSILLNVAASAAGYNSGRNNTITSIAAGGFSGLLMMSNIVYADLPNNMTLVTTTQTADANPAIGVRPIIELEGASGLTINTDLAAFVSADGGSNWTAATFALVGTTTIGGGTTRTIWEAADTLPGTLSTSIAVKLVSANNKAFTIRRLGVAWH